MDIQVRKCINSFEFDGLVTETYKRPYCFQQQDGCRHRGTFDLHVPDDPPDDFDRGTIPEDVNGSEMGVSFDAWLERNPLTPVGERSDIWAIDLFWERNFYPHISMVASDLHKRGLLPAGDYTIVIDW